MAIDSALKRHSAIHVGSPWRSASPVPDGTVGQADRQVDAFLYSGIAASGGGTPAELAGNMRVRQGGIMIFG